MGKLTTIAGMSSKGLKVMDEAYLAIQSFFTRKPEAVLRAAKRLGVAAGNATPAMLLQKAKNNPMTTVLLLLEVDDGVDYLLQALEEESPHLASIIEAGRDLTDVVTSDTQLTDLSQYTDELSVIRQAAAIFGRDQLMLLRQALSVDDSVYILEAQLRDMGLLS